MPSLTDAPAFNPRAANRVADFSTVTEELVWIAAGVIVWFGIRMVSPRIAGYVLLTIVLGAIVTLGPHLSKVGDNPKWEPLKNS